MLNHLKDGLKKSGSKRLKKSDAIETTSSKGSKVTSTSSSNFFFLADRLSISGSGRLIRFLSYHDSGDVFPNSNKGNTHTHVEPNQIDVKTAKTKIQQQQQQQQQQKHDKNGVYIYTYAIPLSKPIFWLSYPWLCVSGRQVQTNMYNIINFMPLVWCLGNYFRFNSKLCLKC